MRFDVSVSAVSAVPSMARPSSALRISWSARRMEARYSSAVCTSLGESDGREISLPDVSFSWVRWLRAKVSCRFAVAP